MRDARRIHERLEVRLDRPQVVWLTLGVLVLLAVSFALGMIAGRRAERLVLAAAEPTPVPIAAVDGASDTHEELTFYDELKDETENAPSTVLAVADDSAPVAAPPKPAPRGALEPAVNETPRTKPAARKRSDDVTAKLKEGPADAGQYTVQVSAFQTMDEARAFAASLERKGFAPFITSAAIPEKGTWYRVRMGAFDNELEATLAKQMLAKDDIPAWVLKTD